MDLMLSLLITSLGVSFIGETNMKVHL